MNYNILAVIVIAISGTVVQASIVLAAIAKEFRHAFQVPEDGAS
jgi:hypothetical protein